MSIQKTTNEQTHIIRTALMLLASLLLSVTCSAWQTAFAETNAGPLPKLIISEFRVRGPNGANDEFVEIYNNSGSAHTVQTSDGSAGYALVAGDGVMRFVIPNGTVIPGRGHYLGVNSVGYSLASYPAGNGTTATGNVTYTTDIPDNRGIALFRSANPANWLLANRMDAVGSTTEANTLYKEGIGYLALTPFSIDYSFYRDLASGFPKETNNNAADFTFVDTNGTSAGAGQRLGAPGPENLASPVRRKGLKVLSRVDSAVCAGCPGNRVRDLTSDPANNSTFGTIDIRRKFKNTTGSPISRLRFRVTEISTFPSPSGTADLRPRDSSSVVVSLTGGGTTTVKGTTLEEPSSQPNGGGFNSTLSVQLATSLPAGSSVNVRFLLGIQQGGKYRFAISPESFPASSNAVYLVTGDTNGGEQEATTTGDYDGDRLTDIASWNPATGDWAFFQSSGNSSVTQKLGQNGDIPASGDYDGDGESDFAVFRPAETTWYIRRSSDNTTITQQFGQATDRPVPADYDADGKTDIAVYRPTNSTFYVRQSSSNTNKSKKWGTLGDVPVPADYDGDGHADFAIFRPSTHNWIIFKSSTSMMLKLDWGLSTDIPVPGDYDRDGKTDVAVWRPSDGSWLVRQSSNNIALIVQNGATGDQPQVGDFDGDGKYDFAVFRPSNATWYVNNSAGLPTTKVFGKSSHLPVSSPVYNQ